MNRSNLSLAFEVDSGNLSSQMNASISTLTYSYETPVSFSFSKGNLVGNYSTTMTAQDLGLKSGIYYLTVSVVTSEVVVSRIFEVRVT